MPRWLLDEDDRDALEKQEEVAEELVDRLGAGMDDEPELRF